MINRPLQESIWFTVSSSMLKLQFPNGEIFFKHKIAKISTSYLLFSGNYFTKIYYEFYYIFLRRKFVKNQWKCIKTVFNITILNKSFDPKIFLWIFCDLKNKLFAGPGFHTPFDEISEPFNIKKNGYEKNLIGTKCL